MDEVVYLLATFGSAFIGGLVGPSLRDYLHRRWLEKKEKEKKLEEEQEKKLEIALKIQKYLSKRDNEIRDTIAKILKDFRNIAYVNLVRLSHNIGIKQFRNTFDRHIEDLAFLKAAFLSESLSKDKEDPTADILSDLAILLSNLRDKDYSEEEIIKIKEGLFHILLAYATYDFTINPKNWSVTFAQVFNVLKKELIKAKEALESVIQIQS